MLNKNGAPGQGGHGSAKLGLLCHCHPKDDEISRSRMGILIRDAELWRARATEARTLAECLTDPEAKRAMLGVAQDCETVAAWAEAKAPAGNCADGQTHALDQ